MKDNAFVDIRTGQISGCRKGSFEWWHEKAHLLYNSNGNGWLSLYGEHAAMMAVFFCSLGLALQSLRILSIILGCIALICISFWIITLSLEERFCNQYAAMKIKRL